VIRGDPLHRPLYDSLPGATRDGPHGELAAFLKTVHALSIEEAVACGVTPDGGRVAYIEGLRRAQADVFPLLDDSVRGEVEFRLAAFLEEDANFVYAPMLLHADLWPEHVLFSRDVGRLAGVIDFGAVSISDPDYDLAFLALRLGSGVMAGLFRHYPRADHARLAEKIRCFAIINAIDDVFIGLDRGDSPLVNSALADLIEQCKFIL
jgi:aminoglycoside 2''-phosphotransferase